MTEDEAIETPTKQLIKAYKTFIKELANEFQVLYEKKMQIQQKKIEDEKLGDSMRLGLIGFIIGIDQIRETILSWEDKK